MAQVEGGVCTSEAVLSSFWVHTPLLLKGAITSPFPLRSTVGVSPSYALTGRLGPGNHWNWLLLRQEYKLQHGRGRGLHGHLPGIGMSQRSPSFFQVVTCPPLGPQLPACAGPAAHPCPHSRLLHALAPCWSRFPFHLDILPPPCMSPPVQCRQLGSILALVLPG